MRKFYLIILFILISIGLCFAQAIYVDESSDAAYDSSWNGETEISPTKNAIYDYLHQFDPGDDGVDLDDVCDNGSTTDQAITTAGITISTGNNLLIGANQLNSGDLLDGTKVADADLGDIDVVSGVWDVDWGTFESPWANTYTIASSGADYTTIQAALDANTSGGELFLVFPGTYTNDTISFTANNQCVVGMGVTPQQLVTVADANIVDFAAYTGCRINNIKLTVTAATSTIDTVTGSTGTLNLRDCHVAMTNSSVATEDQPSCIEVTGAGTLKMNRGTVEYINNVTDGGGGTAIKRAVTLGAGSTVKLERLSVDIDGSNQSLATVCFYGTGTGIGTIQRSCLELDDTGTTIGAGLYLTGSSTTNELLQNDIHVTVGSGTGYGVIVVGTVQVRSMYNHYHVEDSGGISYSFSVGNTAQVISQMDDIIADDGVTGGGTFIQASSQADGKFSLCSQAEPSITIHNVTEEDIEGGRECHIIFKGEQSGAELTTLARVVVQHDGTGDDEKGDYIVQVNDGDDGDSPTERLRIDSAGVANFVGSITEGGVAVYNDDEIDTYSELNAIVTDVTLTHNGLFDTFSELDAIVADKSLVNKADGAVWLGTHDYGGATLEMPNSATFAPAADGAFGLETDSNSINVQCGDGTNIAANTDVAIPLIQQKDFTLIEPDQIQGVADAVRIMTVDSYNYPNGIKIVAIRLDSDVAATTTVNFEEWDQAAISGATIATIDSVALSAATETTETSITDSDIAVGAYIKADLDTADIAQLGGTIWFYAKE
jgi:hypothetical protein